MVGGGSYEKYKTMRQGGVRINNLFYDRWSRNEMKVMHTKFHSCKSIIEEVEKWSEIQ